MIALCIYVHCVVAICDLNVYVRSLFCFSYPRTRLCVCDFGAERMCFFLFFFASSAAAADGCSFLSFHPMNDSFFLVQYTHMHASYQ